MPFTKTYSPRSTHTALAAAAMIIGSCADVFGPITLRERPAKAPQKCRLPQCMNMTTHNGGYCSAECCKKHKH